MPGILFAQGEKKEDIWAPFKFFIGTWEGKGEACPGLSSLKAGFKFVLNERYLQINGKAVFKPQEKNKKGEVHEDLGFISFDRNRNKYVLRQFHVEGFVNQYVLDSLPADGKTFVFVSENIENIPAGWRARSTYKILDEDEFQQVFELAKPGKEFEVYSENRLKRKG